MEGYRSTPRRCCDSIDMTCIFARASLGYNRRLCSNAPIIDRKEIEVRKFSIVHLDACCNFNFLLMCRECLGVHGKATC